MYSRTPTRPLIGLLIAMLVAVTVAVLGMPAPAGAAEAVQARAAAPVQAQTQAQTQAQAAQFGPVRAAVASAFDPGYIISDFNFYNGAALTAAGIQSFLDAQVPTCRTGYTCLKSYKVSTTSRPADAMCKAYAGAANESAATIIYKVGAACGISQKALLVTLEKEQSLVTDTWPSDGQYKKATGYACPDTSGCDTAYFGFSNQVYMAAWQLKRYGNPPGTSNYFTWFPVGKTTAIRYSPTASCGSANVLIKNAATAALYYYTPYQPNAKALANLYGTGDSCSAYGNRNFWRLYTDWFGPTTGGVAPIGAYDQASLTSTTFDVYGWALDQSLMSTSIDVQVTFNTPAGVSTQTVTANGSRPDVGAAYPGAGSLHGFKVSVPRKDDGQYYACVTALPSPGNTMGKTSLGCKSVFYSAAVAGAPAVSRLSGDDRYGTAVAASKAAYPSGGVPVAYIASGETFPDAIAAGAAAAAEGGPLLLVGKDKVPAVIAAELTRLAPKRIVIVGGVGAVSAGVAKQLAAIQPKTSRIGGADRYETARLLAKAVFPDATGAYLASGMAFPDALSAASAAGANGRPILLVKPAAGIDVATKSYLASSPIAAVTLVGSAGVLPDSMQAAVAALGKKVDRRGGPDRYATSQVVNAAAYPSATTAYLATGTDFPDALAGSAVAGQQSAPLFVIPGTCIPRAIGSSIAAMGVKKVVILGGPSVVSDAVASYPPCP